MEREILTVSVVVPVYNVEKYIVNCIESLIKAIGDEKVEIILVNDGSTDSSGEICLDYARKYKNIKLLNKRNGGLSAARNSGMEVASGKYIIFVDSDDYVNSKNLKEIFTILKKSDEDVFMCEYTEVKGDEQKNIKNKNFNDIEKNKMIEEIFNNYNGLWPAWKNIVKKSFLVENKIKFKEGFLHEDIDFTTKILVNMKKFRYLDIAWYYYRAERTDSIMNKRNYRNLDHILKIVKDIDEYLEERNLKENEKIAIKNRVRKNIYMNIILVKKASKEEIQELNEYKGLLSKTNNYKYNIFYYIMKMIGIKKSVDLLCLTKIIK